MLVTSVLSVATGVGDYEWLIFANAVLMEFAFWQFSNNPPNSASMADAMTFLIMLHSTRNGPFSWRYACNGVFDFGPRKKYPPALLRASGSDM